MQKTGSIHDSMNRSTSFLDHLCYFCLVLLCFRARVFIDAMWSPAGKELTSWLTFVFYNCEVETFPLVYGSGVVLDCIDFRPFALFRTL